jgi:predicted Zn-dependent protease with MMP-like domain
VDVTAERFEVLVSDALDGIPAPLAARMENVAVVIEDHDHGRGLLGLYEGVPLTERGDWYGTGGMTMPDRITVFRLPICRACRTEGEVVEQVRVTVVHEVAHHFGMDDEALEALGYG